MLTSCVLPVLVYTVRNTTPQRARGAIKRCDASMRKSLLAILGLSPSDIETHSLDQHLEQAFFSKSVGGLGLTKFSEIADYAFISSWLQAAVIARRLDISARLGLPQDWFTDTQTGNLQVETGLVDKCKSLLLNRKKENGAVDVELRKLRLAMCNLHTFDETVKLQHRLVEVHMKDRFNEHVVNLATHDAIRLKSIQKAEGSAGWLSVLPGTAGMYLHNDVFLVRLKRWLGLPPFLQAPSKCACHVAMQENDVRRLHMEHCSWDRCDTHNTIRDEIAAMCRQAGLTVRVEELANRVVGLNDRRDIEETDNQGNVDAKALRFDLVCYANSSRAPWVGDVTIVHPCSSTSLNAANPLRHALTGAIAAKRRKYGKLCQLGMFDLHVYAMERSRL